MEVLSLVFRFEKLKKDNFEDHNFQGMHDVKIQHSGVSAFSQRPAVQYLLHEPWFNQVRPSCCFGLLVWVFLITLYFDQRKKQKTFDQK